MAILIRRYSDRMRLNHWAVALLFLCAGMTGLAIFHPVFWPFTALFGGGPWTKILHPFFGLGMVLAFVFLFFQAWRDNFWRHEDSTWLRRSPACCAGTRKTCRRWPSTTRGRRACSGSSRPACWCCW